MLIRELLFRDPKSWSIPNLGVAKVGRPQTEQEWNVLKYELQAFVAEGEYEAGLNRILTTFLKQLDSDQQPAAWISGFYGSGKSHLARVLDALWSDPSFPDGARATGLVRLPQETAELVKELRTRQRQHGGAFSAAGTLSAGGGSIRLAVLALVFAAAELPEAYPAARAVLWMDSEGVRDKIERRLAAKQRSLTAELTNMYVSEALAEAIRATLPGYAESTAEVRRALRAQFPPVEDITQAEFLEILDLTLRSRSASAQVPLTLIVLDELQQFMNEDQVRTLEVQQIVEACSSRFGSRLLFVGTGQLQMGSTPQLAKLRDRFQVRVTLRDTDVDRVVRSVVLRKDPAKVAQLRSLLSTVRGEIDRQLAGTKIGPVAADTDDLVADYPLLPARRRFWESILRSVDSGARAGQLRTQLRIVLEATKRVADREVGFVVPADIIYDELESDLQMSGILPRETATGIAQLAAGNDGLAKRIAAAVFLIGKLPKEGPGAPGLRATADTIADLLIDDLRDAGALRQRVPDLVRTLLESGKLIEVDGQLLIQTPTAAEWQAEFRRIAQSLRNDDAWLVQARAKLLQEAMTEALGRLKPTQGRSKTPRKLKLHFGSRAPEAPDGEVPIWVRDEWTATQKEVVEDARQAGVESPIVHVFLPKIDPQQFASRLAEAEAADRTINARPIPTSDEAIEARAALASRRDVVRAQADEAAASIVAGGLVFQAGGNDVTGETIADRVGRAVENGLLRMYPLFSLADDSRWSKVVERARQGSPNPLAAVDHQGSAATHPVGSEIRQFVGASGKRGIEVRKHFLAPQYGWPQDAVDGGLLSLVAEGELIARHNGQTVSAKQLTQNALGAAEFRTPSVVVSAGQRIAVRGLATKLGVKVADADNVDLAREILTELRRLADGAGGDAPLPPRPSADMLRDVDSLGGNEQFAAIYAQRDRLEQLANAWKSLGSRAQVRMQAWRQARQLASHAKGLSLESQTAAQLRAIEESRSLLEDPDPVTPIVDQLATALRRELDGRWRDYQARLLEEIAAIEPSADWAGLDEKTRVQLRTSVGLGDVEAPSFGTTEELLAALDSRSLDDWRAMRDAISQRFNALREELVRRKSPNVVRLRPSPTTIRTQEELESYLKQLRDEIEAHIKAGRPVVI